MRTAMLILAGALCLPAATHYLTVAGLGGDPEYEQRFTALARETEKILAGSGGEARVHTLTGANSTRERLRAALAEIAREARPDDAFVLMLIGHGSYDGAEYKFNLPGPDITAIELAALVDRVPATRQLIVNMTSASGGALSALHKPGRVVISATRSGNEKNATIFARYWVEALRDASADVDKNETLTALEAFRFADRKVAAFYETQKRIATEHAMLEDTGTGEATRTPSPDAGPGMLAARFPILRLGAAQRAAADPAKKALLARKDELEQKIDVLKYDKAALPADEYRKRLSALLVELARVQEEIDK